MKRISPKWSVEQEVWGVSTELQGGLELLCPCLQAPAVPDINWCAAPRHRHLLHVRSREEIKPKTDQMLQNRGAS